jgi:hypothetical protein
MDRFCKCGAVLAADGLCSASDVEPEKCPFMLMDDVEVDLVAEEDE